MKHIKKHIHELAQNYITTHPSVKDTEGLGTKIPISRIGEIATTIGTGALTGGAVMVGEAALTGGLGALTAEGIAGTLIGGGVGAGVASSVGGGTFGSIAGGVIGGISGKAAMKRVRQRQRQEQENIRETAPLLDGQRLCGGNSGFNRLTA